MSSGTQRGRVIDLIPDVRMLCFSVQFLPRMLLPSYYAHLLFETCEILYQPPSKVIRRREMNRPIEKQDERDYESETKVDPLHSFLPRAHVCDLEKRR
jgi:hypothetical protein